MHTWITRRYISPCVPSDAPFWRGDPEVVSRCTLLDLFWTSQDPHFGAQDPSETLFGPIGGGVVRDEPSRRRTLWVYVYPIYYLRPRGRSEPDQKRVLRRGPVHQNGGPERSKIGPKGCIWTTSGGFHPKVVSYLIHMRYTPTGNPRMHGMIHHTYTTPPLR